ncbi:hypothetical protein OG512_48065 [Streptomyces sp. NBC_01378]
MLARWKAPIRELTSRKRSIAMDERIAEINRFTAGWMSYFQLVDVPRAPWGVETWPIQQLLPCRNTALPPSPGQSRSRVI